MVFNRDPNARAVAFELRERRHARLHRRKSDLVCRCACRRRNDRGCQPSLAPTLSLSLTSPPTLTLARCVCSRRQASDGTTLKVTGLHDCELSVELRLEADEEGLDVVSRRLEGRGLPLKAAAGAPVGGRGDLLVEVHLMPSHQRRERRRRAAHPHDT